MTWRQKPKLPMYSNMNLGKVSFLPSLDFPFTILLLYTLQVFFEVSDARRICRLHARRIFWPHYTDYTHNPFQCFPITIYVADSLARVLDAHSRMPYGVIVVRQSTQINNSSIIHELFTKTLSCTTVQWAFAGNVDRELTHRNCVVGSLRGVMALGLFCIFSLGTTSVVNLGWKKTRRDQPWGHSYFFSCSLGFLRRKLERLNYVRVWRR